MTVDTLERPQAETPPRPRRDYGAWVIGAILVVFGALWLLDIAGVIALQAAVVMPALLAVVGLALIVGAREGPHTGLVVFGVVLIVAVVAAAVSPPNVFRNGIGDHAYTVVDQGDLAERYNLGMGDMVLDLRDLDLIETAEVEVTLGAGDMLIQIPDDVAVAIEASVGAGEIDLLDQHVEGVSVTRSYQSDDFDAAEDTLTLDLGVAAGKIEVTR